MPKTKIVNYRVIKDISQRALEAKEKKFPPFDKPIIYPDEIIPEGIERGTREHALYLFHSVVLDSAEDATRVYSTMQRLASTGFFSDVHNLDKEQITQLVKEYFRKDAEELGGSMLNPVQTLFENSRRLAEQYRNDPRLIQARTIDETLRQIGEFRQYGKNGVGKSALLMKNFVRFGIWNFPETDIPLKVDRHIMRICLSNGAVNLSEYLEIITPEKAGRQKALKDAVKKLMRQEHYTQEDFEQGKIRAVRADRFVVPLTKAFRKYTSREKISSVTLDDVLWAIGAKSCKLNNAVSCELSCPLQCPTRVPSDNNAVWFFPGIDKRKDKENLFTYARLNQ